MVDLRRYLATDGLMGKCPDWYMTIQAAKYLGVAPWVLLDECLYWKDKALKSITAESQARASIENSRGK